MGRLTRREKRKLFTKGRIDSPIVPIKQKKEETDEDIKRSYKTDRHYTSKFAKFYDKSMHWMMIIPIILIVLAIGVIVHNVVTTGSIIDRGISLTGGQIITITEPGFNPELVEKALKDQFPGSEISVRILTDLGKDQGIIIEAENEVPLKDILNTLKQWAPDVESKYSVETMGATLSQGFFAQVGLAILLAFAFMSIVVFFLFKTPAPSLAVITCAFSDMVFTIGMINIFHIKLSTAGVAALLMLIGYSVDTDILLTTRLIRSGKGDYLERTMQAMKTGLTMTAAIIMTCVVGLIFAQSDVLRQIFTILLFGAIADIIFTYITNAHLLWWWMEKKGLKPK
jgi:preprotein translocase subunit SecF